VEESNTNGRMSALLDYAVDLLMFCCLYFFFSSQSTAIVDTAH